MNGLFAQIHRKVSPWTDCFKYAVYALLAINVVLFLREEWTASDYVFGDGVALQQMIKAFAASIDTLAWLVLLLMFELETYQIPDDRLTRKLSLGLHALRILCYSFIVYAFYGYLSKALCMHSFIPLTGSSVCDLAAQNFAVMTSLDSYEALSDCRQWLNVPVLVDAEKHLVTSPEFLAATVRLAWVDVINSAAWILVVINLELDVYLVERGRYEGWVKHASNVSKAGLYSILAGAAIYWGLEDDFLPFWDAMLWIVAFLFIELNIFEWQQELEEDAAKDIQPEGR